MTMALTAESLDRARSMLYSSAPGFLLRLQSGILALVWNRRDPEDGRNFPRKKAGPLHSIDNVSWHRAEFSIAFSNYDGNRWTRPVVIARTKQLDEFGPQIAYPRMLERRPGELWVIVVPIIWTVI